MATNQTTNYQLNQWEPTDQVLRTDFNADNVKLDTALAGLAAKGTELEADLAAAAAGAGNCQMELFTYTGTGTCGAGNATKVRFTHLPEIFFIGGSESLMFGRGGNPQMTLIAQNIYSDTFINESVNSWSGTQLSITHADNARYQMNNKDEIYWVLGLYRMGQ